MREKEREGPKREVDVLNSSALLHQSRVYSTALLRCFRSVVDASDLVGYGVGVEDVDVDVGDFNGDNDVDLEDGDKALADDEFEECGILVDEGNDAGGHDGNGDVGDVTYDWYNTNYDDLARHGKWREERRDREIETPLQQYPRHADADARRRESTQTQYGSTHDDAAIITRDGESLSCRRRRRLLEPS
uniref:Uncharacterized protein n=1 Tax=Quercus lobata TaxID=97700 RepID=A0A7N2MKG9_QUELO